MRSKTTNSKLNIISILLIIVFTIVIWNLITIYNNHKELKKTLLKDWKKIESAGIDNYYELELDFSEDTIEYNFISIFSWLNKTLDKYEYKILTNSKIKINNKIYKIEFNKDKTMMTITPSLTDSKSSENWFYYD